MPEYIYKASDRSGKVIEGSIAAGHQSEVVSKLRGMGYIPIRISAATGSRNLSRSLSLNLSIPNPFARVSGKDLLPFTQELTTLVKAGLPLDRSLSIIVETTESEQLKSVTQELLKDVRGGKAFSEALAPHPHIFSRLYINMIKAGEAGGVLDVVLERLSEFLERSQELKGTVVNALIYPAVLISVMGVIVSVLLLWVVPKFVAIFDTMGQDLPLPTQMLLSFSMTIQHYWWLILGLAVGGCFWFHNYTGSENGRRSWDAFKLRIAVVKELIIKVEVARFSRTLGTLITSGVPLLQALMIVKEIIGNTVMADSITSVHKAVKEGKSVSAPLKSSTVFPPLATHMIRVGEETGRMEEMLMRVADTYDKDVRNSIKRFIALLEPFLILFMALIVLCIVLPIIYAIFSINEI